MAVNLGDKIRFRISACTDKRFENGMDCPAEVTGRVIYIHPRGRFCVAEAEIGSETIREALPLDREGRP